MKFSDHPVDILKQLIVDVGGDVDPHTETQLRDLCNQMVCSLCGAHQPQWTKEPPTVPGWYWLKNKDRVGSTDIEICFFDGTCANFINGEVWYLRDFADSKWCGPLISPI